MNGRVWWLRATRRVRKKAMTEDNTKQRFLDLLTTIQTEVHSMIESMEAGMMIANESVLERTQHFWFVVGTTRYSSFLLPRLTKLALHDLPAAPVEQHYGIMKREFEEYIRLLRPLIVTEESETWSPPDGFPLWNHE